MTCHVTFLLGVDPMLKCGRPDEEDCFHFAINNLQNVIQRVVKH